MTNLNQTNIDKYEDFLASVESDRSRSVYKSYSSLGEFDYTDCDYDLVVKAIIGTNPKNIKAITTVCTTLRKYARFLGNTQLIDILDTVDREKLWETIEPNKPNDVQKYISHSQYEKICNELEKNEYNPTYYLVLFMAIYEGIYSNDMSVLKNLRLSDIDGNRVMLHPDNGEDYSLKISKKLITKLKELAGEKIWRQASNINKRGYIDLPLNGRYYDTCFKTVQRHSNTNEMRFYRVRLWKIAADYIGYALPPYDLFVSGIAYRIAENLKSENITLQEAFRSGNRKPNVGKIFEDELKRCHYPNEVKNFRELIKSYLDVFLE